MPRILVQFFHELSLKGKNRPLFLKAARRHALRALGGLGARPLGPTPMGLLLEVPRASLEEATARLRRTLGVERVAWVEVLPRAMEALEKALLEELPGLEFQSFRITVRRQDKAFPLSSPEMERRLGALVQARTGAQVRLKGAEREFRVLVLPQAILLERAAWAGLGGLPPGVAGRVVVLLSGGLDSPVAAYRLMRRGAEVVLVHFHPFPLLPGASREKAKALAQLLVRYQHRLRLYLVPFAEVQRRLLLSVPKAYRVVFYRRYMLKAARLLARKEGALALATGDSLGQVSSQTLENLRAVEHGLDLPVFRPLLGWDKGEIMAEAQSLGTYPISILPDEECCTLFTPDRPVTKARLEEVLKAEARLDQGALLELALAGAEALDYAWPRPSGPGPEPGQEAAGHPQEGVLDPALELPLG